MVMIICPDCGKEQDNLHKFCRNCGADLSNVEPVEEAVVDSSNESVEETVVDSSNESIEEAVVDSSNESIDDSINVPVLNEDGTNSNELILADSNDDVDEKAEEKIDDISDVSSVDEKAEEKIEDVSSVEKEPMKCSECGTEIGPNVKFCPNCGKSTKDLNQKASMKYCPSCGTEIGPNIKFCPYCGLNLNQPISTSQATTTQRTTQTTAVTEKKTPIISVILSFIFPGLGQFYNGQGTKGLYFIIMAVISWILMMILIGILLYILVWIWSIFDAYKSVEAINRGEILEDKLF